MKLIWPAPERNKGPLLEVLQRVLPPRGRLLEIASGTGQHVAHFARHMPAWRFLPTDVEPAHLASVSEYVREAGLANVEPPQQLDVSRSDFELGPFDAVLSTNLIHIAPWECAVGLVAGAARCLVPDGLLLLYGPFRVGGAHTAPSNEAFDADLRARDARWGVRDVEAVSALANGAGLDEIERVAMPANNLTIIWRRRSPN